MAKINVKNTIITTISVEERDYISLTDMANAKESESRPADIIKNWLRSRYTLEFLGTREQIYNPGFKVVEFDHFKSQAGLPGFVLSVAKWIEKTKAIGIILKRGKYGGAFAHKDIAAVLINENISQKERLIKLNRIAIQQMIVLQNVETRKLLK